MQIFFEECINEFNIVTQSSSESPEFFSRILAWKYTDEDKKEIYTFNIKKISRTLSRYS